jgi:hypothetical protein
MGPVTRGWPLGTAVVLLLACGVTPLPPAFDLSGTWVGTVTSTTPQGDPVYGTYDAKLVLEQNRSVLKGSYSSSPVSGSVLGAMGGDRVELTVYTANCNGSLVFEGHVNEPAGSPPTLDLSYDGYQDCSGEQVGSASFTKQ